MKKTSGKLHKPAFLMFNKGAVFCLSVAVLSIVVGLAISRVLAVTTWEGPTQDPPGMTNLQPPINTSVYNQQKEGGLIIASGTDKLVGIGDFEWGVTEPTYTLDIDGDRLDGDLHAVGAVKFDSGLDVNGGARVKELCVADFGAVCISGTNVLHATGNLFVGTDQLQVDVNTSLVNMSSGSSEGVLNVGSSSINDKSAIYAVNADDDDDLAAIQGIGKKWGVFGAGAEYGVYGDGSGGGTGVYGVGDVAAYGVWGSNGGVGMAGVYGDGFSNAPGVAGKGYIGISGSDKDDSPLLVYPTTTYAGWFKGDVMITDSSGDGAGKLILEYGDLNVQIGDLSVDAGNLTVDASDDTLYVDSVGNRVGIGTDTLENNIKLEVKGGTGGAGIYTYAGDTTGTSYSNGPNTTVAAIYAKAGQARNGAMNFGVYAVGGNASGTGTSNNYGVYAKAGASSGISFTYGIYGVTDDPDNSYAGYFKGPVSITNNGSVPGTLTVKDTVTFQGDFTVAGVTTLAGDLQNSGGLYVYSTGNGTCVPPTSKDNGTMYVCESCSAQTEYTTLYVYLDNEDGNGNNDWIQTAQNTKSIAPNNCSGGT